MQSQGPCAPRQSRALAWTGRRRQRLNCSVAPLGAAGRIPLSIYTIYLSILVTPVVWAELLGCPYGASSWSGWINEEFRVFSMYDITKFIEVHLTRNGRHESSSGPTKSQIATSDNRQHVGP
jgi:hypothetical protein